MAFSRRVFIQRVSEVLGASAAMLLEEALADVPATTAVSIPRQRSQRSRAVNIVILGAGIAGLAAAFQLRKMGYRCHVLEARGRVGGRNWTLRGGDSIEQTDGSIQRCEFESGLYFNCGAARIPTHHTALLSLCKELGVALEIEVNANRSAYLYNPATSMSRPQELRQIESDTRGHVSELLVRAIEQGALSDVLPQADQSRMLAFLRRYGDLAATGQYRGSARAGYRVPPGAADQMPALREPLSMNALLDADLWDGLLIEDDLVMQATMLQPVGGMDAIPKALQSALGDIVQLNAEVREIRRTGSRARVVYRNRAGALREIEADFCISTIPLPVLANISSDFSAEITRGLTSVTGGNARKIAFEAPRFWEQQGIYGGLSYLLRPFAAIWYPSGGWQGRHGILVHYGAPGPLDALTQSEQFAAARLQVEMLHPGHSRDLHKPISVTWNKIPYSLGVGAYFHDDGALYTKLNLGDGPFYFASDYLSRIGPWQEGALQSAYRAINLIEQRQSGL